MKKLFILAFAVAFVCLGSFATGAEIKFYEREALVQRNTVEITDTILFKELPGDLTIPLLFSVKDFSSSATFRNYECSIEEKEYGSLIECKFPEIQSGRLTLQFKTDDLTKRIGGHFYFKDTVKVPAKAEKLVYTTKLKSGLVLIPSNTSSPFPVYSPKSGEKGSDGRRIFVYWSRKNVKEGEGITPSVSYEVARKPREGFTSLYTFIAGVIILIILFFLALRSGPEESKTLPLKEDESEVIDIVKKAGAEIKQKRIVNNTDFSKAKVSRLVKDLEERGLLEKEKVGRTNRIKLKEESE